MAKWADYLISAVRYVETKTTKHISHIKVHRDLGDSVGESEIWSREDVVNAIDLNSTFITIFEDGNNTFKKGAEVEKIRINNEWFITTEPDQTKKDNLGNLPEF